MSYYLYWHPGDQRPEKMPEESEYYEYGEWHTDVGNPNIGWLDLTRRWPVPEHAYRAHMFCETFGIKVPEGYEVTGFRASIRGETYLTVYGNVVCCAVDRYGQPHPILRKIKSDTVYRTPTDEDARSRPQVEVRDADSEKWRPATLLAVRETQLSSQDIDGDYTFVTARDASVEFWHQCRMKENKQ